MDSGYIGYHTIGEHIHTDVNVKHRETTTKAPPWIGQ